MKDFSITPKEMIASFWQNRKLIKTLAKREVVGRYRGSVMGVLLCFSRHSIMPILSASSDLKSVLRKGANILR